MPEFQVIIVYKVLSRYLNLSDTVEVFSYRNIQATLFNIRRIRYRLLPEFQVIIVYKVLNRYLNLPDTVEDFSCRHI